MGNVKFSDCLLQHTKTVISNRGAAEHKDALKEYKGCHQLFALLSYLFMFYY